MSSDPRRFVLTRFLPACSGVVAAFLFARLLDDPTTFGWEHWLLGVTQAFGLTFGFGGVVALLRSRMAVESYRPWGPASLAAGVIAPFALGLTSVFAQGASIPGIAFASLATGCILGGALTVPWLRPWATSKGPPRGAIGNVARVPQLSSGNDLVAQMHAPAGDPAVGADAPRRST